MSAKAAEALSAAHPAMAAVVARHGVIELEPQDASPYAALCRAIVFQQLSGKAARTIFNRFAALFGEEETAPPPDKLAGSDIEWLRSAGLSRNKALAVLDLAEKTLSGVVPDRAACDAMADDDLVAHLTAVRGVGPWTAQMFLMFTLARPDIWPAADLGVRQGWRIANGWEDMPPLKGFEEVGEPFRPYRTYAAMYLWKAADTAVSD